MKPLWLSLFFWLACTTTSHAAGAYFTTVFFDDEGVVYVGMKSSEQTGGSQVISLPFSEGERTNFPLPEEIAHREVIGLITEKQKLFVLTGGAGEKHDGPMLHVLDRKKNTWKKVGQVDCAAFTRVDLQPKRMVFSCEVGKTKKGHSRISRKVLALGRQRIYRHGTWRFPEFLLRYKGRTAVLEGPAPKWDKLRLRSDTSQRTLAAEELFQAVAPAAPKP